MAIWKIDEGLENVQHVLDERAASIGGECKMNVNKNGDRILVVQRRPDVPLCDKGTVEATVEAMQMDLVHKRDSYKGRPTDAGDEHERRKLDKDRDQKEKSGKNGPGKRSELECS